MAAIGRLQTFETPSGAKLKSKIEKKQREPGIASFCFGF